MFTICSHINNLIIKRDSNVHMCGFFNTLYEQQKVTGKDFHRILSCVAKNSIHHINIFLISILMIVNEELTLYHYKKPFIQ